MKRRYGYLALAFFVVYVCGPLVLEGDMLSLAAVCVALYSMFKNWRAIRAAPAARVRAA